MNRTPNINPGDADTQSFDELPEKVAGAAIEIHRHLGPGLMESACEDSLCYELNQGVKRLVNKFPSNSASPRLRGANRN